MFYKLSLACLLLASTLGAQYLPNPSYNVSPLIGSGNRGDGGPAAQAILDGPAGLAQDASGNIYVSEANAGVIRRIRPNGTIEHFTGTTDDPITPTLLLAAPDGGILYFDTQFCRLRKVHQDGTVEEVAGTGKCTATGYSGWNRELPARQTLITSIGGMTYDHSGLLIYTEPTKNVVRRIDADGYIRTIAGTGAAGFSGDTYPASTSTLDAPAGVAVDGNGRLYIADAYNCRVRYIDSDQNIQTAVGTAYCARANATYTGGSNAALERLDSLVWDSSTNSLLIAMPRVFRVVRFDLKTLRLSQFIGSGTSGTTVVSDPLKMPLNSPSAVLPSAYGVLVADKTAYQVYSYKNGAVSTFAGHWPQVDSYPSALSAQILAAEGTIKLPDGSVMLGDSGANRIVRWQAPDTLTSVAGIINPTGVSKGDNGPAISATVSSPRRFLLGPNGDVYFGETTRIRAINSAGIIRTVVSNIDGLGSFLFDPNGLLIYTEANQARLVQLDLSTKKITVLAGVTGVAGYDGDGDDATLAYLNYPGDIAYTPNGDILIADRGNRRIRIYTFADGFIRTLYGSGLPFPYYNITGDLASKTGFGTMDGMVTDAAGNIFVADQLRVCRIDTNGVMSIVTGLVSQDDNGVNHWMDGPVSGVGGVSLDAAGNVYVSEKDAGRVLIAKPMTQ